MRLLGIDYGTKRIGLALSDPSGRFPAPFQVLDNSSKVLFLIQKIVTENEVGKIIIGQSLNYKGAKNEIMKAVDLFKQQLAEITGLTIEYEPEILSSKEAERLIGRDKDYDARAAAIILKSYIDRQSR